MKRLTVFLLSCLVLAGGGWMAHSVWGQAATAAQEKTFTITQTQLDKYVADQVAKALAADREKSGRGASGPVSDEQVLKSENWHRAVFDNAEWVVYTGPGQFQFHHWVQPKTPPAKTGTAPPTTPTGKAN
jgi:hypothetical protein